MAVRLTSNESTYVRALVLKHGSRDLTTLTGEEHEAVARWLGFSGFTIHRIQAAIEKVGDEGIRVIAHVDAHRDLRDFCMKCSQPLGDDSICANPLCLLHTERYVQR